MADYISLVPTLLREILTQTKLSRDETCCKLRELIVLAGGGPDTTVIYPGMVKLTSGGTASFTTATPLQGTGYNSVSLSVISLSSGTVTVTDANGTTDVSYPGFSNGWQGSLNNDLVIEVTGDAVALVTYTAN